MLAMAARGAPHGGRMSSQAFIAPRRNTARACEKVWKPSYPWWHPIPLLPMPPKGS